MLSPRRARAAVLTAAVLFSTGGLAIKWVDLTPIQISGLRSAIAAAALLLLLPAARRSWSWRSWVVGVAYATTFTLFVLATRYTTAANAVFLQATAPVWVLALSPWLLRERVGRRDLAFIAVVAVAMTFLLVGTDTGSVTAPRPALGNLLAVSSGISYALALLGMRWLADPTSSNVGSVESSVVAGNLLAVAIAAPFIWPLALRPEALTAVAYLGLVQVALAYWFVTRGLKRLRAAEASLLLLLEPVLNPLWVWLGLAERPSNLALLGCALMLLATAAYALRPPRQPGVGSK